MMIKEQIHSTLQSRLEEVGRHVGNTPLFEIKRLIRKPGVRILAKLEWQQIGGSVKSRPAFEIIRDAVTKGHLTDQKELLDASSGNTAIAYAALGAALDIPITICLPENASEERKRILKAFGAKIIFTSKFGTTDEAQDKALELYQHDPLKYFYADQYNNENNWKAHYRTTAAEIIEQTQGKVTHFVSALGTTGTFTGVGRRLKEEVPGIRTVSLQPDEAMHGLEGWKHLETARVPGIYDAAIADENLMINTYEAIGLIPEIARQEGLLVSPSAAANLIGALEIARKIDKGTIVTVFPDNAEKYGEIIKSIF